MIIGTAASSVSFEGLENRQLMSGVSFAQGIVSVSGSGAADAVHISLSNDGKTLSANLNGKTTNYKASGVYRIDVATGNGNDTIVSDAKVNVTVNIAAGDGNDSITTGNGADIIRTQGGNDVVNSGAGNDFLEGGDGNDRLDLGTGNDRGNGGAGNDSVNAGEGNDTLIGEGGDDTLSGKSADAYDAGSGNNKLIKGGKTSTPSGSVSTPAQKPVPVSTTPSIRKISLINADTGEAISGYSNLTDGMTLDLSKLPAHLSIVAETDGKVESARFSMSDGSAGRVDDSVSYSLTAPSNGKLLAWSPKASGTVKLSVTPYSADEGKGSVGTTTTMNLKLLRVPTPAPVPTPVPTPTPTPAPVQTGAPAIKINSIQTTVIAGQAYHGEATQTTIPSYQVEDATFAWDFGDPTGRLNNLPGFNAAHVYETPGTYTATLTVTSPSGQSSTQNVTVNVVASNYKTIYVSATGNDTANGLSTGTAVKSLTRVMQLVTDNTQILFKRGEVFQTTTSGGLSIGNKNIVVGSYGNGSSPTILYTGARNGFPTLINVSTSAKDVSIEGITFNSIYTGDGREDGIPQAIVNGGTNVTIRDNTFLNVSYAINNNALPKGVLIMDNKAPLATGLRSYFVWCQGTDLVIVNNTVANSTRQHIVRSGGTDRMNISYNNFNNIDRTAQGDAGDTAKGTLVVQKGSFAYVAYNQVHGPVGVGPLGQQDGLNNKGARFSHSAFEGNVLFGYSLDVHHGAEYITLRGNTIYADAATGIKVEGYDKTYGRGITDLVIDHNVGINTSTTGSFLYVYGATDGITLTNNVYVAPNFVPGSERTAAVFVNENSLNSFRRIDGNVWPSVSRALGYARGGEMIIGTTYASNDHKTPAEWNAFSQVGTDQFTDVTLDNVENYAMKITSSATQAVLRKAA